MADETIVECEPISPVLVNMYGHNSVFLTLKVARRMQQNNELKIIKTRDGQPLEYHVQEMDDKAYLSRKSFVYGKNMTKVLWIQDYHKDGGAELSNLLVVRIGHKCGFDIVGMTKENFNEQLFNDCDVVVVNNFFEFDPNQLNKILCFLYEGKKPYIKYEHDHRELQRPNISQRLFSNAALCVFISPSQRERHAKELQFKNSIDLPLAIDTALFVNQKKERRKNSVLIPSFNKCREKATRYIGENHDKEFMVIGISDFVHCSNVRSRPNVDACEMLALYNEYETMWHKPDKVGGGERVLFEAALCGCKIDTDENASHVSWGFDLWNSDTLRNELQSAPYKFWNEAGKIAK